jgi:hypothetical protein
MSFSFRKRTALALSLLLIVSGCSATERLNKAAVTTGQAAGVTTRDAPAQTPIHPPTLLAIRDAAQPVKNSTKNKNTSGA